MLVLPAFHPFLTCFYICSLLLKAFFFFWKIADRVTVPHLSFLRSSSVGKTKTAIIVTALTGWKRTRRKKKKRVPMKHSSAIVTLLSDAHDACHHGSAAIELSAMLETKRGAFSCLFFHLESTVFPWSAVHIHTCILLFAMMGVPCSIALR